MFREGSLYKFSIAQNNLLQLSLGIAANGCSVQASWKAVSLDTPDKYGHRHTVGFLLVPVMWPKGCVSEGV